MHFWLETYKKKWKYKNEILTLEILNTETLFNTKIEFKVEYVGEQQIVLIRR